MQKRTSQTSFQTSAAATRPASGDLHNGKKIWFLILTSLSLLSLLGLAYLREQRAVLHTFDTGLYLQLLENLKSYKDWSSSVTGEKIFLAHHFQPIVGLILPFYMLYAKALTLFILSAFAVGIWVWIIFLRYHQRLPFSVLLASCLAMIWHPSISGRVFFSFAPEVFALPLLAIQALFLAQEQVPTRRQLAWLLVTQIFAGLCKENIWLINAFVALLLVFRWPTRSRDFLALSAFHGLIFGALFLVWMPAHSVMPQYYGLRYYGNPSVTGSGWIALGYSMLLNLVSPLSLSTLILYIVAMNGFVPFLAWNLNLFAAIPGILLILTTSQNHVHEPINQYQILCLPFLWMSGLEIIRTHRFPRALNRLEAWLPLIFLALPASVILPGIISNVRNIQEAPQTRFIVRDIDLMRRVVSQKAKPQLLVDANLQPLLADFRHVAVILEYTGNPRKLTAADRAATTDVITAVDPRSFASCRQVKGDGGDVMPYDYQAFYAYCEWMRSNNFSVQAYPDSMLYHFQSR